MFPVLNHHRSASRQSRFYHQYMQQHAEMTRWIQQLHQNVPAPFVSCCDAYRGGWNESQCHACCGCAGNYSEHSYAENYPSHQYPEHSYAENYPSHQPAHNLQESYVSAEVSCLSTTEMDPVSDEVCDDEDESECEYEFNVDAILAMRAAKKELDKVSEESEESFVVIEKEEYEFVELGSLKTLESKRAEAVGYIDVNSEYKIEQELRKKWYGEKAATIGGLETAMSVTFEHMYDKHQPPLWPVLPVRL